MYGSKSVARRCGHLLATLCSRVWSSMIFSPPTRPAQSGSLWATDPSESFLISKSSRLANDDLCQPSLLPFALGGCFEMTMKYDRWSDSATLTGGMKNISYISSRLLVRAALPLFLFLRATAAWAQSETNQPPYAGAQQPPAMSPPTEAAIAFVNVSVISMDSERVESGQTVIVRG